MGDSVTSLTHPSGAAYLQGAKPLHPLSAHSRTAAFLPFILVSWMDGPWLDIAHKLRAGSEKTARHLFHGKNKSSLGGMWIIINCLQAHNRKKIKKSLKRNQNKTSGFVVAPTHHSYWQYHLAFLTMADSEIHVFAAKMTTGEVCSEGRSTHLPNIGTKIPEQMAHWLLI